MSTAIPTAANPRRRAALAASVPDFCPSCDAVDHPFREVVRKRAQEFRGEILKVMAPALRCHNCGFEMLGPGHLDALRLATTEAYRRAHGLLTAAEIIGLRKAMHMSQQRFAEYLGVGVASLKRWETGVLVPDKANDLLIRERTHHIRFSEEIELPMRPSMDSVVEFAVKGAIRHACDWFDYAATTVAQTHRTTSVIHSTPGRYALAATA